MRCALITGAAVMLLAGSCSLLQAGWHARPQSAPKASSRSASSGGKWLSGWFRSESETEKDPVRRVKKPKPAPRQPVTPQAKESDSPPNADRLAKEQQDFLRRLAVCDKLRQIAMDTNDQQLLRKAEELHQRAWELCMQRTERMTLNKAADPLDQDILRKHLGSTESDLGAKAERLYTVPGQSRPTRTVAQEEWR